MKKHLLARSLSQALSTAALLVVAGAAGAQATAPDGAEPTKLDTVQVVGEISYRDRAEEPATLVYDLDYFQRFEPLTVGDMLKRVPSVAFLSDVLEYDGVRLRGLDPGYTQILINGKRVPGAGFDRAFFVDRIPAELVERIEIVRSSSADRSGDAVAGALNIVLRDGLSLDGGYLRLGALHYNDGEVEPTVGMVWGGEALGGNLLLGFNRQGRRNPKEKFSQRFDEPGGTLDNVEVQTDVRSGDDTSFNADYRANIGEGQLALSAFFVRTDRLQDEDSLEYADGIQTAPNLLSVNDNDLDIRTDNFSFGVDYGVPSFGGQTRFRIGFAGIDDEQYEFEDEYEYLRDGIPFPEDDRYTGDRTYTDLRDRELSFELRHERDVGESELRFGVEVTRKERETSVLTDRNRITIPNAPTPRPAIPGTFGPYLPLAGGLNRVEEKRIEPFVRLDGEQGAMEWEIGLRYQYTDVSIHDYTVDPGLESSDNDYGVVLPSGHLRWNLDDNSRLTASIARTMRRPNFDQVSPALLLAELGDNDLLGNPDLKPEDAWGVDLGWERRLGRRGVVGLNFFYRDIKDLIEIVNTGEEGDEGEDTFVLQPRNAGDGQVWGAEFDLSTPLSALGLDNTGVFLNYSWLDSEIEDVFGTRRFNDQSGHVLNVGFIQELPELAASFGVTYREQGDAFGRIVGEEVRTTYDGDLEAYVEKRFGTQWTLRFTGSNLLNASKSEVFDKFSTIADQIDRSHDEYELENEVGGRVYQMVVRYSF
ncbi:MAG: TonB-dependent receptor [Gammaproteobacteria bacterium RIFCSPHIGHO2_12_FULL_63_22]|nr:MAG: TonB-dependent receptor [Gammaproteobacteria bacterium RIFCSPHIGHO2_12_FULL_63_22]